MGAERQEVNFECRTGMMPPLDGQQATVTGSGAEGWH